VPQDDPTLLFTNAGMVQFKRTFLGEEKRPYARAVTSQKCVRAGGKHNDLENVGYTARHHTFFEMLGNFSFGDYFKEKAIEFAWDLLTNGYGLPADKLYASVFFEDDDAYGLWQRVVGLPDERIVRFGEKDNFWAMGDTGPCGPCSEILIDRGPQFGCGKPECKVGCDCDRYLEIWNLVFMQFNRDETGTMTPLPKPSIDTGMGLERIVSIIQDVPTNYDTDLIRPILEETERLSGKSIDTSFETKVAMKVIADHSRAAAFLIGDGVLPSNEGRGYVLRRILRRAIRYGRHIGLSKPFLHRTAAVVFDIMKPTYPELLEAAPFIMTVIENEERRFSETLDNGMRLLEDTLAEMQANGETVVPGGVVFKLYDTYGFPVDIVQDVIRDKRLSVDMEGFDHAMAQQRAQSRSTIRFTGTQEAFRELAAEGTRPEFVGYDRLRHTSDILVLAIDGKPVDSASTGQHIEIVTRQTPFYGEAGGQMGDRGLIQSVTDAESALRIDIHRTIKDPTGIIIHQGTVRSGDVRVGEQVELYVDEENRRATACNHTATHILHAALRSIIGDHVKQAGSLVSAERLRFDFTHFSALGADQIEAIEKWVNACIRANVPVSIVEMAAEDAFKTGAMALFEEKYGDRVRVISLADFSKELCGGTHTDRTGNIGLFKILSEASVASGVRRIEALTGDAALTHIQSIEREFRKCADALKGRPEEAFDRIEKLIARQKSLEKEMEAVKLQLATGQTGGGKETEQFPIRTIAGVSVLIREVAIESPAALREVADRFRDRIRSGIVVLGAKSEGKAMLLVAVTKDLSNRFHAGKLIQAMAETVGGKGGGRPDLAQAGGPRADQLSEALELAVSLIEGQAG
jgi:alanyl-tRNA synthetase